MIGKAQAEKFFNEIRENLTKEVYLDVGKKLEEETKKSQEAINEKICERIVQFDMDTKKYIDETLDELRLTANSQIKNQIKKKFQFIEKEMKSTIKELVKEELEKKE